jgi:hypothetical protein
MTGFSHRGKGDKETVGHANGDRANVLKFWHASELFSAPGVRPASPCKHIYLIASDRLLPGVVASARRHSRVHGNAKEQEDSGHGR